MRDKKISLLFPVKDGKEPKYRSLSEETIHNLGLDAIVPALSTMEAERSYILRVLSHMTDDPFVAAYRADVFEDILNSPELRDRIMKILDKIRFLREYGTFKRDYEESASAFELIHRLEEINDYIISVEAIHECLADASLKSEGLRELKEYADAIYNDNAFAELKEDISKVRASTTDLKSITLGVNLNPRFEAESIGVVSINNKPFTKSGVIGAFSDAITSRRDHIQDGNEWNGNFKYQPINPTQSEMTGILEQIGRIRIATSGPIGFLTMAAVPEGDSTVDVTRYMDRITNHMLFLTVRKLRNVLSKYVNVTITNITDLIPEFMYYIRWAEYTEKVLAAGYVLKKPEIADSEDPVYTEAHGVYNLLLAHSHLQDKLQIVRNDLVFDREHNIYILTGANRGGKTTITVAVGLLFVLAQGGIYIPGGSFKYMPVDCIYTHFPADEDKTMDLGRLGEECKRFKELYNLANGKSLLLLNETFSTTSFEEGYYIARDAVRAMLKKGVRTIYNTHMHKLARDIEEINSESNNSYGARAQSLIVKTDGSERSFKIAVAPPAGMSYAEDIARKYGVTYDMLTGETTLPKEENQQ
ncbi:MAG: DNA mismatch repair protein [Lachnospiraceae bacterium]|nr:DNA mismatch repair protein [Lachnospiraceae bacterium]